MQSAINRMYALRSQAVLVIELCVKLFIGASWGVLMDERFTVNGIGASVVAVCIRHVDRCSSSQYAHYSVQCVLQCTVCTTVYSVYYSVQCVLQCTV